MITWIVLSGAFCVSFTVTILSVSRVAIARNLGADTSTLVWLISGLFTGFSVAHPLWVLLYMLLIATAFAAIGLDSHHSMLATGCELGRISHDHARTAASKSWVLLTINIVLRKCSACSHFVCSARRAVR